MRLVKTGVCGPNRLYVEDFCDDFNYKRVILYIGEVDFERLYAAMGKDYINKLWRLTLASQNTDPTKKNFIYIENCDMQNLDYPVHEYMEEGYDIYILHEDDSHNYYIEQKLYYHN